MSHLTAILTTVLVLHIAAPSAVAQDAASRAAERSLEGFPAGVYFTIPPRTAPAAGKKPPLLVVLPGGDGSREFLPFVENGILGAAPADCVGVLVTWPNTLAYRRLPVNGVPFGFVAGVTGLPA